LLGRVALSLLSALIRPSANFPLREKGKPGLHSGWEQM
jgi:hypothetical protein